MKPLPLPNFISLFLVIGALAGNAQIAGFDIFLILAAPVGVMLITAPGKSSSRGFNFLAIIALLPFALLFYRALEIDPYYFELYWLWPIKAVILAALLSMQRGDSWPITNDVALAFFAFMLLWTAEIEEGRLISFFGPNMLYRFFGVTFLMSVFRLPRASGHELIFLVASMAMSSMAMILTGSVGAILVFGIAVFVARDSVKYLLRSAFGFVFLGAAAVGLWVSRTFLSEGLGARITHKIENLDRDERFYTWSTLLNRDTGWLGENHSEFSWLWTHRIPYPHNSLVELYSFYGLFGAAIALVAVYVYFRFRNTNYYFFIPFTVIFVGSMISGDMSDNFAMLSFPLLVGLKYAFFKSEIKREEAGKIPVRQRIRSILMPASR